MKYSHTLKKQFPEISLNVEDLLQLESFQIKYLPDRVPKKEFAVLLHEFPIIQDFLILKYPPIEEFLESVSNEYPEKTNQKQVEEYCQELLWEIADLIIYNKYPDIYDARCKCAWKLNEIMLPEFFKGKVVLDVGAGTGNIAFQVAEIAKTVYAVEPLQKFRQFIKNKAEENNLENIFAIEGYLDDIPFSDSSVDVLLTSNAMGWNLDSELKEIERVLRPEAKAIHLFRITDPETENSFHDILTSHAWKYVCTELQEKDCRRFKYKKTIKK